MNRLGVPKNNIGKHWTRPLQAGAVEFWGASDDVTHSDWEEILAGSPHGKRF